MSVAGRILVVMVFLLVEQFTRFKLNRDWICPSLREMYSDLMHSLIGSHPHAGTTDLDQFGDGEVSLAVG